VTQDRFIFRMNTDTFIFYRSSNYKIYQRNYNPDTSSIFICLLACRSTYEMYKIYLNTCSRFFVGCCVVHFFDATSSQPNHAVLPFMLRIISIAGLVEDFCNKVLITDNELGRYKKKPAR